ncbi:uncharacterized protein LOC117326525 [Pecten maximus]|uniref:uncharacterized protein LOC117326525 n=1 Tax=Pecten maximus TaxID=6579 RepID=UPI001458144D|nr:uncharacterized protein LOC117326525 [Pecten maximus]
MILWINGITNLSYDDQVNTFRLLSAMMSDKCRLVFSADITHDRDTILKAYNDDEGCSRTFIQHAIVRLNKDEGSQIALTSFKYAVDFISDNNPDKMSFVRAYIQATRNIRYPIPGLGIDLQMKKGERLYFHEGAGFSCKYTLEQLQYMVEKAGLRLEKTWTDDKKRVVFCQCTKTS